MISRVLLEGVSTPAPALPRQDLIAPFPLTGVPVIAKSTKSKTLVSPGAGRPLLIGQGKNDPRVKEAQSRMIVEAMQAKNLPVT